ncbi:MAG: hypothetical protein AB8G23_09575 [Myxococcota bacterium]
MIPLNDSMREKLNSADAAFADRPIRERIMISALAVGLVFFLIDLVAIQPIASDRHRVEIGTSRTRDAQAIKEQELAALASPEPSEEERRILADTELVKTQIAEIEKRMASEIEGLVPPHAIVSVLEELLAESPGLHLVRLESTPPHRVGARLDSVAEENATSAPGDTNERLADGDLGIEKLFRHGVRIEVRGDFRSTVDYLQRVEQSRFHLMWDNLDYRVESYPTATVTIDFHTISHSEEWIGV